MKLSCHMLNNLSYLEFKSFDMWSGFYNHHSILIYLFKKGKSKVIQVKIGVALTPCNRYGNNDWVRSDSSRMPRFGRMVGRLIADNFRQSSIQL